MIKNEKIDHNKPKKLECQGRLNKLVLPDDLTRFRLRKQKGKRSLPRDSYDINLLSQGQGEMIVKTNS
jgi:hypothetical protein